MIRRSCLGMVNQERVSLIVRTEHSGQIRSAHYAETEAARSRQGNGKGDNIICRYVIPLSHAICNLFDAKRQTGSMIHLIGFAIKIL